jgi:hypothetical protein
MNSHFIITCLIALVTTVTPAHSKDWLLIWTPDPLPGAFSLIDLKPVDRKLFAENRTVESWAFYLDVEFAPNPLFGFLASKRESKKINERLESLALPIDGKMTIASACELVSSARKLAGYQVIIPSLYLPTCLITSDKSDIDSDRVAIGYVAQPCAINLVKADSEEKRKLLIRLMRLFESDDKNEPTDNITLESIDGVAQIIEAWFEKHFADKGAFKVQINPESLITVISNSNDAKFEHSSFNILMSEFAVTPPGLGFSPSNRGVIPKIIK